MSGPLLAQLSDPHLRLGAGDGAASEALAAAVRAVLALRPVPDAVLVTGDIADTGAAGEYARARELLAPLPMPLYVLPGNHDDRDSLREHFPPLPAPERPGDPVQYTARVGDLRLVACDTTRPGREDGSLDGGRLAWLEAQLAADVDALTVVAMHHHPLTIGIPALDAIGLDETDRRTLAEMLARAPHVRRVVAGHVHRTAFGALGGCGVLACTSSYEQARLEIGAQQLTFVDEAPAFALHVVIEGEVISHLQPIDR